MTWQRKLNTMDGEIEKCQVNKLKDFKAMRDRTKVGVIKNYYKLRGKKI